MASLPVYDISGKEVGKYEVDPNSIADKINKQLLHDVVVMYQANARQGSFATKSRAEVAGSTKKMYKQKGTGNARAGSRRSNIRRGGGHAFAKKPRDFSYRLPRKAVRLATRMAIASKVQDAQVIVVDELKMDAPQTKKIAAFMKTVGLEGKSTLIATNEYSPVIYKSARNLPGVEVAQVSDLNAFSILRPDCVVVSKAAMDSIKQKCSEKLARRLPPADKPAAAASEEE